MSGTLTHETEVEAPDDPVDTFVTRAASGQRAASRYLAETFVTDAGSIPRTVLLLKDPRHLVRQGAAEALLQHVSVEPSDLLAHAAEIRAQVSSDDAPFRTAILGLLAALAREDASTVEPVISDLADQLGHVHQFAPTGYAAIALARYGASSPSRAKLALPLLAGALAKKPKEALARELLTALEEFVASDAGDAMRESVRDAVKPLIAHPNPIVRERSTKLYMRLG